MVGRQGKVGGRHNMKSMDKAAKLAMLSDGNRKCVYLWEC